MKLLRELVFPLIAIVAAFMVGAVVVLLIGDDPILTYQLLIGSALSWPDGIGYTLFYATPLIFTGLAVAVAFRCGLLNIGAEGQLTIAAFAAAWAGITFANQSAWLLIPACCLAAILSGAVWGAIPGILKARFGSHEVINTIMMNFIAAGVASALTQSYFKVQGDPILQTGPIGAGAQIARLGRFIPGVPERIPLNLAFPLALVTCVLVYIFLWRTKWGYEIRATGANPAAAEYGGVSVRKQVVLAMAVSGGLAGLVAINEVLGYRYRYYQGFSPNYGFTGIAVALLGRNHPGGVLLAALFFGALIRGGLFVDIFTENVSKDLVLILQALVILFVASEAMFRGRFTGEGEGLMELLRDIFSLAMFFSTIRLATPLLLAALGGLFSERSGVINIALEGLMLAGAFTAATVTYYAGSPWVGLAAAAGAGVLIASIHAIACIQFKADQVVTGTAINILMLAVPTVVSGALFGTTGSTPQIPRTNLVPTVPIAVAFALVPIVWYLLYKTPFGLRLRAVGENPEFADTAGVSVSGVRYLAVLLSGMLAALGGAYLSIGQSSLFTRNMTAGRGFIALAALIFGKWRPVQTMLACLLFGSAEAAAIQMQGVIPYVRVEYIQIIPYVLTMVVLAGFIGASRAPRALGQPYQKER